MECCGRFLRSQTGNRGATVGIQGGGMVSSGYTALAGGGAVAALVTGGGAVDSYPGSASYPGHIALRSSTLILTATPSPPLNVGMHVSGPAIVSGVTISVVLTALTYTISSPSSAAGSGTYVFT